MSFDDYSFDQSSYLPRAVPEYESYGHFSANSSSMRLPRAVPEYESYSQLPTNNSSMRLPVPPPPNAVQYPRITLKAENWSPSRQCFIGECALALTIEQSNLPTYVCKASYTISYIPVNEWIPCPVFTCQHSMLIVNSKDLRVVWHAIGEIPVVDYTRTLENHWNSPGVDANGPCELLVLPVEGSDYDSYVCTAFYELHCEPLEDWKEAHEVAEIGYNFRMQEASSSVAASVCQSDVKPTPAYEPPKTKREYFEQFPLPSEVAPLHYCNEHKESEPVEKYSGEPSMHSAIQSVQDTPKNSEKQEMIYGSIISKSQERFPRSRGSKISKGLGDPGCVAAENKLKVTENKGSYFLRPLNEESLGEYESTEWNSDEEEEADDDETDSAFQFRNQENSVEMTSDDEDESSECESDSNGNESETEFQVIGNQENSVELTSDDEDECSESESDDGNENDSSQKEKESEIQAIGSSGSWVEMASDNEDDDDDFYEVSSEWETVD